MNKKREISRHISKHAMQGSIKSNYGGQACGLNKTSENGNPSLSPNSCIYTVSFQIDFDQLNMWSNESNESTAWVHQNLPFWIISFSCFKLICQGVFRLNPGGTTEYKDKEKCHGHIFVIVPFIGCRTSRRGVLSNMIWRRQMAREKEEGNTDARELVCCWIETMMENQ